MRKFSALWPAAMAAALLVAACGGGGDGDQSTKVKISSVKVMGDSLSDSGTFAGINTVRIYSVNGGGAQNWTERVAGAFGVSNLCNFYKFTGATFVPNPTAGCTSYGVGGGRINYTGAGGIAAPFSIIKQMRDAAAVSTTYTASDLLLIDGGGNDAADLVGAYLAAQKDGGASFVGLVTSLGGVAPPTSAAGFPAAANAYMTVLANTFFDAIKANALDKGATHVAVINMPSVTNTPRFQMVLDSIGAAAGAAARTQSEALFRSWVATFNTQLATRVAGNSSVVLVDFATSFDDEIANPAQYGLTNVKTPACPITGVGSDGLPTYNFMTCTDTALSAMTPPAGATGGADWWKTYAFSDGFHPTPFGYQLLAQLVTKQLVVVGWL